ncbi:MAG: aspartate aminotransferase family protein, partial [Agromyces sp.]
MTTSTSRKAHRRMPADPKPLDHARVAALLEIEWNRFRDSTTAARDESTRAKISSPLGVTSSFQYWDPYPLSIVKADGAYVTDVDGRRLLDLSMGFGGMLVGHRHPHVMQALRETLDETGTLFVTPAPLARDAAERLCRRFGLDMVRFTNSGTESTMYALRVARAYTGRMGVVKVEGGYHGSYDEFTISTKPPLDKIGAADNPTPYVPLGVNGFDVYVVPYNDADALERMFKVQGHDIACFIVEPVLENIGIVLPDDGYLERVRELCTEYNIVLIFDEVKTGLTAGHQGAAQRLGVAPDLQTFAKSIGGGVPVAAFGGKREFMEVIADGRMPHFGTYNGNPLSLAGLRAVDEIATPEALATAEAFNMQALNRIDEIIDEYHLPAHTVGFGVKGCITWATTPTRNYRDYKHEDMLVAELSWLWALNRGIMTPPGQDDQWLISFA